MGPNTDADLDLIARSRRFRLGRPRDISFAGASILFLRSRSGTDPVNCLWRADPDGSQETLLVDPADLVDDPAGGVCAEERSRRERVREVADGIVAYSCDAAGEQVTFALAGRLFVVGCGTGEVAELPVRGPVMDPRFAAAGRRIAFVTPGGLHVVDRAGAVALELENPGATVRYGVAEFVAAEELGRHRGFWWSPDGDALLVTRVDDSAVATWWRAEPDRPREAPVAQPYAAAGAANADVTLLRLDLHRATTAAVSWDRARLPYLVAVSWPSGHAPLLTLMDRAHSRLETVEAGADGATRAVHTDTDESWVYLVPGTPAWLPDGRLLHAGSADDTISLFAGDERITPPGLQVGSVASAGQRVLFTATTEPVEQHVYAWQPGDAAPRQLSAGPGVHSCDGDDRGLVLVSETLDGPARAVTDAPGRRYPALRSVEQAPAPAPVEMLTLGDTGLRTAVLFPRPGLRPPGPLPVLMDPYGGPLSQRVRAVGRLFHEPQWFADQGFAVIVADGRGSPNRGPAWERAFRFDVAGPALEDQVTVLGEVARRWPGELDLGRVAMRGWSFGGYLSALAVLRRPDVFAAGIAGAPVSDWRDYDSVATERYLGLPSEQPAAYARTSLLEDPGPLRRPLMLVHGLADDNVQPVHSFQLTHRLTAAGTPPRLVTLPRATHLLRQPEEIATLLRIQLDFLRDALSLSEQSPSEQSPA